MVTRSTDDYCANEWDVCDNKWIKWYIWFNQVQNCAETLPCMLEALVWWQSTFVVSRPWPSPPSTSSFLGGSWGLVCFAHILPIVPVSTSRSSTAPSNLFHLTLSSIHAWARTPSHPTDTPASVINSLLLGLSIHSAHCWEPLKQDNSCIPSSHWA